MQNVPWLLTVQVRQRQTERWESVYLITAYTSRVRPPNGGRNEANSW